MKMEKVLDEREITVLQGIKDTEVGRAIFHVAELEREDLRREAETEPKIDNDVKKDVRYKLGGIKVWNQVLDLPRAAQTIIQRREKKL